MWILNTDTNKWERKVDTLNAIDFNSLKQDLISVQLYSKALSGSNYSYTNDLNNVYESLGYKNNKTWYISPAASIYNSSTYIPNNGIQLDKNNTDEYSKYVTENGFTIKNYFTPIKTIDNVVNYINADIVTTGVIDLTSTTITSIDNFSLKNGNIVLVKDQITNVSLSITTDTKTYFTTNYYEINNNVDSIDYYYYNEDNGLYTYENGTLTKIIFDSYEKYSNLSIYILNGNNIDKQFHLSRKLNGYFPVNGEPLEFLEKHNWVVRNQVDCHDLYENNYFDILKHATQSFVVDSFTYTIPERLIYVGDFGVIVSNQEIDENNNSISHYMPNNYIFSLKSIEQIDGYYFICGDNGTLLKVSKIDFSITYINLKELNNLTSISFYDNNFGVIVGKFNTIYYTENSGITWKKLILNELNNLSFNSVYYYSLNKIYIGGESGLFLELNYNSITSNKFTSNIITVSKFLTATDEYKLIEDINSIYHTKINNWSLTYSTVGVGITSSKDCLFLCCNNNNLIIYEINNFVPEHDFIYIGWSQSIGDITTITKVADSSQIILSANKTISFDINQISTIDNIKNLVNPNTYSVLYNDKSNKIFDYNGNLYNVGNIGLSNVYNYATSSYVNIDSTLSARFSPKMLFLDYDIATKMNFFDSNFNYRLPICVTFSNEPDKINFTQPTTDNYYIQYLKDIYSTYGINSDTASDSFITLSTLFQNIGIISYTYSNTDISTNYDDIKELAPFINSTTQSKYSLFTAATPSNSFGLYIYNDLIIIQMPDTSYADIGDMLNIQNDVFQSNLLVNYVFDKYAYCFHDFNDTMINDLKNYNHVITIMNLNKYVDSTDLLLKYKLHPLSVAYNFSFSDGIYTVQPLYNNYTAYYNLECVFSYGYMGIHTLRISYDTKYNEFEFTPYYNVYNFLTKISDKFNDKKFYIMPEYVNLPGNNSGSLTSDNIYIDANVGDYPKNKLIFGKNLKFEFDSLWLNTFVDITLHTSAGNITSTVIIVDKHYDISSDAYVMIFNDKIIPADGSSLYSLDIMSRNSLTQISDDLSKFSNINKYPTTNNYNGGLYVFDTFDYNKVKINLDSYAKILLSDGDVKKYLNSIIYTENDILKQNIINVPTVQNYNIDNTFTYATYSNVLGLNMQDVIYLNDKSLVYLKFTGGSASSEVLNTSYTGLHTINKIDDLNYFTYLTPQNPIYINDIGVLTYNNFDPFFNYYPVDIWDVGNNGLYKTPLTIKTNEVTNVDNTYIITNNNNYRFALVDNLNINDIINNYHWLLEAEISDAVIGQDANGIVWYSGIWHSGRWFGGTWYSGTWITGDWYGGTWYSSVVKNNKISTNSTDNTISKWFNGRWFDGTWNGGTWYNGRWYDGIWRTGVWRNGTWNAGTWYTGVFNGGIWVQGRWIEGIFNSFNKPSYWIDGKFISGEFQNGMWYNGEFGQNSKILSKFGTLADNDRNATWHGGNWLSGNFYSNEYIVNNEIKVSPIHKYSTWYTGVYNSGNFYGGIVYNIEFNNGIWHGGVVNDIQIIGVSNPTINNIIALNGIFRFNIGNYINIINNGNNTPYINLGNDNTPGRYRIALVEFDLVNNWTLLTLDYNLSSLNFEAPYNTNESSDVNTKLKIVSKFKKILWKSGLWKNGIFEGGVFNGGIWKNGIFTGTWSY